MEREAIIPELYGTEWCEKTGYLKTYFSINNIQFKYFDAEKDENAANKIKMANGGKLKFPYLKIGEFDLFEPSIHKVEEALIYYCIIDEF